MSTVTSASATTPASPPKTPRSLLDLPKEVRLIIYHHMFDGQHMGLRPSDRKRRLSLDPALRRKRRTGSNLMFTNKMFLNEVKPILLRVATFDFASACGNWLTEEVVQGFSYRELSMVSSLVLEVYGNSGLTPWPPTAVEHLEHLSRLVVAYNFLTEEVHLDEKFERWMESDESLCLAPVRKAFVDMGFAAWLEHIRKNAARNRKARLEIRFFLGCWHRIVVSFEKVSWNSC